MNLRPLLPLALILPLMFTTGCGGGGGSTPTPPPAVERPVITTQPMSQTVQAGQSVSFTVVATGPAPLTYQWSKNDAPVSGATAAIYSIPSVATTDAGIYKVVVSNPGGPTTSNNATLTVSTSRPAAYAGNPAATQGQAVTLLAEQTWESYPIPPYPGAPSMRVVRNYRVGYSETLRNPLWTAYCTFRISPPSALPDRTDWLQDPGSAAGVVGSDYTNSGYTRGHMVPRADIGYRYGADAAAGSMIMTNLCPQLEGHNTTIWEYLESLISGSLSGSTWNPGLADDPNHPALWVTTGPVFSAQPALLPGPKGIAIPSAFYKILVREATPGQPKALAILTPHIEGIEDAELPAYVTSIQRIQELTGLAFFPELGGSLLADLITTVDVRGWGSPFATSGQAVQVHMIEPSWDITVPSGTTVTFRGAATSASGTITGTQWAFGDEALGAGTTTSHTYTNTGVQNVIRTATFTATDSTGASRSLSRRVTVLTATPHTPPTIGALAPLHVLKNQAVPAVALVVHDAETPAEQLLVTATSSNLALVPQAGLSLSGTGGNRTLGITPVLDQVGASTITVTVTDGDGLAASASFVLTISTTAAPGRVIISQYYEGTSSNKWLEITNVGGEPVNLASPQLYLCAFNNAKADAPDNATPDAAQSLTGTLAPGECRLYRNTDAVLPAYASGTPSSAVMFNGDDLVILSTSSSTTAWAQRLEVVGNGTTWGENISWIRAFNILQPNPVFTPSEWTQRSLQQVEEAAVGTTERLGVHLYAISLRIP